MPAGRPTVAEIDLTALSANYRALARLATGAELMAIVKADAYGHGAVEVARALASERCVTSAWRPSRKRASCAAASVRERIYVMGGFFPDQAGEIVALDVDPVCIRCRLRSRRSIARRASRSRHFKVHLKIDSGASRLGIRPEELDAAIAELKRARSLEVEGVCTLLANAGDPLSPANERSASSLRLRPRAASRRRLRGARGPCRQLRRDCATPRFALQHDPAGTRALRTASGGSRARRRRTASRR